MSFPRYPKYKDSGVEWLGEVPEHWELRRLKFLCDIQTGDKDTENAVEDGQYPFFVRSQTVERINSFAFDCEAVLTAGDGVGVGKVFHYHDGPFDFHQRVYMMNEFRNVSGRFLFHFMKENFYKVALEGGAKSTVDSLRRPLFTNFPVAIPPVSEQRSVVEFVECEGAKIDELVAEQRRLIELLKEKRQAVISHAVTKGLNPNTPMKPSGIEWLGDVPEHWMFGPLKRFWDVVDCKHVTVPFFEEGYPVASVMEVRTFELDLSRVLRTDEENYQLLIGGDRQPQKGDVIYCRNTANTGTSAYVGTDEPICIGQDVVLIKSRQQSGRFLNFILHGEAMAGQLSQYMVGSTFKRINVADIRELIVTCPPKDEQDDIVKFIDPQAGKFDTLIAQAERAIELLQERRTALISAAVTGKINVRGFVKREAS